MLLREKCFTHMIQQIQQRPVRIMLPAAGMFVIIAPVSPVSSSVQTLQTQLHIFPLLLLSSPPLCPSTVFRWLLFPLSRIH